VGELLVFGGYLRDVPRLGDVDLAAQWEDRHADRNAQYEYGRRRAAEARASGRTFHTFFDELTWPDLEVRRYLMGRSPAVSLHDFERDGEFVRSVPHRVLWRARDERHSGGAVVFGLAE
jgi:hypothetical protein